MLREDQFCEQIRNLSDAELVRLVNLVRYEQERRDVCEHGIRSSDYCEPCNCEYKRALAASESDD